MIKLNLLSYPKKIHPRQVGKLRIFNDGNSALSHICDHMLTAPEALHWYKISKQLYPSLAQIFSFDFTDYEARRTFAKGIWKNDEQGAKTAYTLYASLILNTLQQSQKLGWIWKDISQEHRDKDEYTAFGLWGIQVYFTKRYIKTAMLPGLGIASYKNSLTSHLPPNERFQNPLPREMEFKAKMNNSSNARKGKKNRKGKKSRSKKKSHNEISSDLSHFSEYDIYTIFLRAAKSVKKELLNSLYKRKSSPKQFKELLKDFSQWSLLFEEWKKSTTNKTNS